MTPEKYLVIVRNRVIINHKLRLDLENLNKRNFI